MLYVPDDALSSIPGARDQHTLCLVQMSQCPGEPSYEAGATHAGDEEHSVQHHHRPGRAREAKGPVDHENKPQRTGKHSGDHSAEIPHAGRAPEPLIQPARNERTPPGRQQPREHLLPQDPRCIRDRPINPAPESQRIGEHNQDEMEGHTQQAAKCQDSSDPTNLRGSPRLNACQKTARQLCVFTLCHSRSMGLRTKKILTLVPHAPEPQGKTAST